MDGTCQYVVYQIGDSGLKGREIILQMGILVTFQAWAVVSGSFSPTSAFLVPESDAKSTLLLTGTIGAM